MDDCFAVLFQTFPAFWSCRKKCPAPPSPPPPKCIDLWEVLIFGILSKCFLISSLFREIATVFFLLLLVACLVFTHAGESMDNAPRLRLMLFIEKSVHLAELKNYYHSLITNLFAIYLKLNQKVLQWSYLHHCQSWFPSYFLDIFLR